MQVFTSHLRQLMPLVAIAATASAALLALLLCAAALAAPPPIGRVTSPTHPIETRWYADADPSFCWPGSLVASPAVEGYSYVLDQNPVWDPDTGTLELPVKPFGFLPPVDYAAGALPGSMAVGDFNRDGRQDLAAAKDAGNTVAVLLGNGDGTFGTKVEYAIAGMSESIAMGDFNRDRRLDLVTANWNVDNVSILLGHGDGTFGDHVEYGAGDVPLGVAVADFNRDGRLDLATANSDSDTISVLRGHGDGTFGLKTDFPAAVGHTPEALAVGDFDSNGKRDVVTANQSGTVSILLGNGAGAFGADTLFGSGGSFGSVAVCDMDNDGKQDLVAGAYGTDKLSVLFGDGAGAFAGQTDYATGDHPNDVVAADLNADGDQDVVTANAVADSVSVLMGAGAGTLAAKSDLAAGDTPTYVAVGDFNADGQLDLVTANCNAYTVGIRLSDPNHAAFTDKLDGVWYFHVRTVDNVGAGGTTATRAVRIDTTAPRTKAPYLCAVLRGHTATLKYKVVDPRPGSPTAGVTIRIKTRAGRTVKTLRLDGKAVNRLLSARFRCRLARGRYRFRIQATDQAGNISILNGSNILLVR